MHKCLAEPKVSNTRGSGGPGGSGAGIGRATPQKEKDKPAAEPDRLRNGAFNVVFKTYGIKIGKVSTFLKKIAPPSKTYAFPPKMEDGATFCLNWHIKGHCWSHCDHKASHIKLPAGDVSSLTNWLEEGLGSRLE
jgi:hypothetical protein